MPDRPPTMQDIAVAACVHQTTVSRALRNDQRLPEATRRRIQDLAESMGYRPHPLVSALVAQRRARHPPAYQATIAVIMRGDCLRTTVRFHIREHLAGVTAAADRMGYRVESFLLGVDGLTRERLDAVLINRSIYGLIIAPLPEAHGHFDLSWDRFSTVAIEYSFNQPVFDRVLHDSYAGMRRIMQECRLRGLRRVGLALTTVGHERTELLNGAAYWVEQHSDGFFYSVPPLIRDDWSGEDFTAWLDEHRLEAVITSNDLLEDVQDWAARRNLVLGRDLHLINVNSRSEDIAGIHQDPHAIGAMAGRMVIEKINHNDRGIPACAQTVLIPGRWRNGATLRPVCERNADPSQGSGPWREQPLRAAPAEGG